MANQRWQQYRANEVFPIYKLRGNILGHTVIPPSFTALIPLNSLYEGYLELVCMCWIIGFQLKLLFREI